MADNEAGIAEVQGQCDMLRDIVAYAPAGLALFDGRDLQVKWHNRSYTNIQEPQYHGADLRGLALREFQPGAEESGVADILREVAQGQARSFPEFEYKHFARGVTYYSWAAVPVPRADNHCSDVLVTVTEITEQTLARRQAEAQSAEIEQRFLLFMKYFPGAAFIKDEQGNYLFANDYIREQLGTQDGPAGNKAPVFIPLESPSGVEADEQRVRATGQPIQRLEQIPLRQGLRSFLTTRFPIPREGAPPLIGVISRDVTDLVAAQEKLLDYQRRLRALTADLTLAEQRERQRLATVIHDEIAQTLGAVKLQMQALRTTPPAAPVAQTLDEIRNMVDEAIRQSRTLMLELSPPILQQQGLVAALQWWAGRVEEKHDLGITVQAEGVRPALDRDVEAALFQMTKELLQNTIKHAQATTATIYIKCTDTELYLEVADDGVGFDQASVESTALGGFGLFSIRERVGYMGGTFEIDSAPGQGTRSTIHLPLPCEIGALKP